ncbi:hypothetical protein LC55x_3925 [Lysobacter capsici]|nr:hypothetical protein LC55x_3925 [Lysobacter capsici]
MSGEPDRTLMAAGALSALAVLLHLGCIVFGAPWYRALGAGEWMAQASIAGHWYPTVATLVIASVLTVWSLYAFSAAGVLRRLPLLRTVMFLVTAVYLLRGLAAVPMMSVFPGRSVSFWLWSSGICLGIGVVHLIGLLQVWKRLGRSP